MSIIEHTTYFEDRWDSRAAQYNTSLKASMLLHIVICKVGMDRRVAQQKVWPRKKVYCRGVRTFI